MSGVHRLLSRRDKERKHIEKPIEDVIPASTGYLGDIFVPDAPKKKEKEDEKKIKTVQARLQQYGISRISPANIEYALDAQSVGGSVEGALKLCLLLEDTYEGLLTPFDPSTKLLGAVNRENVTCYLDALLFAMFARLDGFEAMLYNSLDDAPRKRLAGVLRLWVNLLRTGRLITVDVTRHVQAALAECGWSAAAEHEQQDTSEAFSFITGQLELPLLTLKMDLYHTGKEDPNDDHKFVNERLLEVAVLDKPRDEQAAVTLEDCLEHYFNNRVEVKRHLERQRRMTAGSTDASQYHKYNADKASSSHIETVELGTSDNDPTTPGASTPDTLTSPDTPTALNRAPMSRMQSSLMRARSNSIFNQRRVQITLDGNDITNDETPIEEKRKTSLSTRTEVLMPAWQFFKLLPWYTDHMPTSDAQVAAHFATKRPILAICLKRYTMDNDGRAQRLGTYIDIPTEIAVPDFVSDDDMEEGRPLVGNFKLVLQSVVCHRGSSVHSGHYISLVRGHASNAVGDTGRSSTASDVSDSNSWMLFDDLARERIRYVNIETALKEETPYLLFYQVQPVDEDEPMLSGPPSYDEAISRTNSDPLEFPEKLRLPEYSDNRALQKVNREYVFGQNTEPPSRTSLDIDPRGRPSTSSDRRSSIMLDPDRLSVAMTSNPPTPGEESKLDFLRLSSRRSSRQSGRATKQPKSRPTSVGAESASRFSLNMSKLTTRLSRQDLPAQGKDVAAQEQIAVQDHEPGAVDTTPPPAAVLERPRKKEKEREKHSIPEEEGVRKIRKKGQVPERDCVVM